MDFCNNESVASFLNVSKPKIVDVFSDFEWMYRYFSLVQIAICIIGVFFNLVLVVMGWRTVHKSPVFRMTLNLATTDALASFMTGLGSEINSLYFASISILMTIKNLFGLRH